MKTLIANDPNTCSANLVAENIARLKTLFPELITEGAEGAAVNVDVLKQLVGDKTVTDADEKYGLTWHGKRRARQLALKPSTGTLRPCPEDSVDWDTTQDLLIEGDNLEVLKLLQKSYAGKVKLIYIDPPYNTGKNFIYPDDFTDNIRNYLELAGQVDNGRKISSNTEISGRFHTNWLNMMYPRLILARDLLSGDGVLFVNIDDTEAANLRKVLDEIFGEENFIANVVWQKKYAPQNDATYFSDMHDHILVYAKQAKTTKNDPSGWSLAKLERTPEQDARYKNPDSDPRGPWKPGDLSAKRYTKKDTYPITTPSGRVVNPPQGRCWCVSKEKLQQLIADNRIWFGDDGSNVPHLKRFRSEVQDGIAPTTWWPYSEVDHNQEGKQALKELMDGVSTVFDTPKPVRLMKRILHLATKHDKDALVMDFFAGSGTLGHAVMEMNQEDNGNRKFILVQLPEPIEDPDFRTIADLTKERLRRVGEKIKEAHPDSDGDTGFRVFKLDSSNIRAWEPDRDNLEHTLLDHTEHLKDGRSEQDILYELLLKLGLNLCEPIEAETIADKAVYSIGGGVLMACLGTRIERNEVEPLALGIIKWHQALDPAGDTTCVFRDSAFADDVAKTNLAAILQQHGITNVRSL